MKNFEQKIKLLHDFVLELSQCGTVDEVYLSAITAAKKILNFSVATVLSVEKNGFVVKATTEKEIAGQLIMNIDKGICGRTLRTGKSQLVADVTNDQDSRATSKLYKSCISVPLEKYGVFQTFYNKAGYFSDKDLELTELFVSHIVEAVKRIETEKALRLNEQKYRMLVENQSEGVASTDKNDIFVFSNPAGEKIFGVETGELIGRNVKDFIDLDDVSQLEEINIARERGESSTYELKIIRPDGEKRFLEISSAPKFDRKGNYDGTIGIFRDVTRRKHMEEALKSSEIRFRELFENLVDGAYQTRADGKILAANPALVKMLGYKSEKELCSTLNVKDCYVNYEDRKKGTRKPGSDGELRNVEITLKRRDGSEITVLDNARAIMDENGQLYYEGTLTDITERKQAQQKLKEAYETLETTVQVRTAELAETVEDLKNQINDRIKAEKKVSRYAMRLEAMHEIDKAFHRADSLSEVAQAVLSNLGNLIPNQRSGVMLFDMEKEVVKFLTLSSDKKTALSSEASLPLCEIGQLEKLKKFKPVIVDNIEKLDFISPSDSVLLNEGLSSYMMIPLSSEGILMGSLNVCSQKPSFFKDEFITIAVELASQLSIAIEKAKLREMLRQSEERYSLAVRGTNDGIWDWDILKDTLYLSPRWKEMLGITDDNKIKSMNDWFALVHPKEVDIFLSEVTQNIMDSASECSYQYRIKHADGHYIWCQYKAIILRDDKGEAYRIVGSQSDITEQKKAEEQLFYDAFHDGLTGLANRALFLDHLEHAVNRANISNSKLVTVFFLDIDRFNIINDSFSHSAGDDLLIQIGKRISNFAKTSDTVARLGGDEFALLMEDLPDFKSVRKIAKNLLKEITHPFNVENSEIFITASMGIAICGENSDSPEDFLRNADIAMYRAKKHRNRYEIFDDGMHARMVFRLKREREIRQAIDNGEFTLYYQPILELKNNMICGFEALIRWNHPDGKLVLPGEFLPVAEDAGLMPSIGRFILKKVCSHIRRWQELAKGANIPYLNTNVSNNQFLESGFPEYLKKLLSSTKINPVNLKLEITESAIIENPEAVKDILTEVKAQNVKFQLDDFGTGYSSMSYLIDYPFDGLKIDKSFIAGIADTKRNLEVVKAILSLGNSLGLDVVSEGVETQEQLNILSLLGCKYTQGFFHYRPMPFEDAEALMLKQLKSQKI